MNRYVKSFLIALFLYILLAFVLLQEKELHMRLPVKRAKFHIQNLNLIAPKKAPTKKIIKPIPKPKPKKKIVKKKPKIMKKIKKIKKRYKPKRVTKRVARVQKEKNLTKRVVTAKTTMPSLQNFFAKKENHPSSLSKLPPQLRKLYKDEFSTFTKTQQKFILDNLAKIGEITQKYLYLRGYPYIAIKTRQEGLNAVEFYLHPNGDISDLHLITSSGYEALDKNSIETIKTAFKDYPRPKTTTKIKIYVKYSIIY